MKAILHDVSRCRGCMSCVEACAEADGRGSDSPFAKYVREPLSADRLTTVEETKDGRFLRRHCLHCLEPACATACLVGALHKTADGPVVYDADKCIGCRYCMLACPVHAIKYEWDTPLPFVRKCQLCYDRPGGPACVQACPHDATMFGEREELLRVARERIRARPEHYIGKVWGEREMGGTCVLFISDVSLDEWWPASLGDRSIPDLTVPLAHKTPWLALGVAGFLTGASWIIGRRNRLAGEKAEGGSDRGA